MNTDTEIIEVMRAAMGGSMPAEVAEKSYAAAKLAMKLYGITEPTTHDVALAAVQAGTRVLREKFYDLIRDIVRKRKDAEEKLSAIINAGHKPECAGINPQEQYCDCGWTQKAAAHQYIERLERRSRTMQEAVAQARAWGKMVVIRNTAEEPIADTYRAAARKMLDILLCPTCRGSGGICTDAETDAWEDCPECRGDYFVAPHYRDH